MKIEDKRKEKWVQICQIQGYEDVREWYWISNSDEDKVINRNTGKILKVRLNNKGYKRVNLRTIDGKRKTCKIHILKAKAFLFGPNPLSANVVRHLNDVKTDNRLENLAFGTMSDNMKDCIRNGNYNYEGSIKGGIARAKITSKPVRCIETGVIYPSTREAERCTGIFNASISYCCLGKRKTASKYHWEFVDKQE